MSYADITGLTLYDTIDMIEERLGRLERGTHSISEPLPPLYNIPPGSVTTESFAPNAITTDVLGVDTVQAQNIMAESIDADRIQTDAIRARHILAGQITADHFAVNTLVAGLVAAGDIAGISIKGSTIESFPSEFGGFFRINGDEIVATADGINATLRITNAGDIFMAGTVHAEEGSTGLGNIGGQVDKTQIGNEAILNQHLTANAVNATVLDADSVFANHIVAGEVKANHLSVGSVTAEKITVDAIDGKTITGATLRTGVGSQRFEVNRDGAFFQIDKTDGSTERTFEIDANTGIMKLKAILIGEPGSVIPGTAQADPVSQSYNRCRNSSFEGHTYRWNAATTTTGATVSSVNRVGGVVQKAFHGDKVAQMLVSSEGATSGFASMYYNLDDIEPDKKYTFSAHIRPVLASRRVEIAVQWYDKNGVIVPGSTLQRGTSVAEQLGKWVRPFMTAVCPVGADYVRVYVRILNAPASEQHMVDAVQFEETDVLTPYKPGPGELLEGEIQGVSITPLGIKAPQIATDAILSRHISTNQIIAEHIAVGVINADHIMGKEIEGITLSGNLIRTKRPGDIVGDQRTARVQMDGASNAVRGFGEDRVGGVWRAYENWRLSGNGGISILAAPKKDIGDNRSITWRKMAGNTVTGETTATIGSSIIEENPYKNANELMLVANVQTNPAHYTQAIMGVRSPDWDAFINVNRNHTTGVRSINANAAGQLRLIINSAGKSSFVQGSHKLYSGFKSVRIPRGKGAANSIIRWGPAKAGLGTVMLTPYGTGTRAAGVALIRKFNGYATIRAFWEGSATGGSISVTCLAWGAA